MFWLNQAHASTFMPPQATEIAAQYDKLYGFLVWASLIASVLVIGGFIFFALKYKRRTDNDKTAYITHDARLEFAWSFIPFVIFMVVFAWGTYVFHKMRTAPKDAFEVHAYGQKWKWDFWYKSGKKSGGELVVPVNTPVKLILSSRDVIHSFFVPAFRVKQDVVPGRYTSLWFEAKHIGNYQVFCTEYCGLDHSNMLAKVRVVSTEDFEQWLQTDPYKGMTLVEVGEKVYSQTHKCNSCHTLTEQKLVGPGFMNLFGKQREFADGSTVVADENYIRESILNPNAKVVKNFPPAMTPFAGQISEQELMGVIEFIKTLKN